MEESNPIQVAIDRDGFAYVRTSKKNVLLYDSKNLVRVEGTIKKRDSLLFATQYVEQDAVKVALSDGTTMIEGYVRADCLRKEVVDAQTAAQWLSGGVFTVNSHPIGEVEYVPASVEEPIESEDDEETDEEADEEVEANEEAEEDCRSGDDGASTFAHPHAGTHANAGRGTGCAGDSLSAPGSRRRRGVRSR